MNDEFLPIDDYGIIGNDDRCALVGRNGSVDWWCVPHLESPSVFAGILDPETGGRFVVRPATACDASHAYVDRTNVLETTFETEAGTAVVTDFMPVREGQSPDERFQQSLYRKISVESGTVDLDVRFEPRFDYARATTVLERTDRGDVEAYEKGSGVTTTDGTDQSVAGADGTDQSVAETTDNNHPVAVDDRTPDSEGAQLFLHTDADFTVETDDAVATASITVEEEETRWLCLQYGSPGYRSDDEYQTILEGTIEYWRSWLDTCEESATDLFDVREEWHDVLVRSALVLKLLIHEETGSIPAAATTSLPEEMGGELNWDYRFNWIRDAKFTIQALHSVGQSAEAHRYFEWFREIGHEEPQEIQPLYGLHGESDLEETVLEHLSGYRGSTPVRIGNAAAGQEQLDIYGTIVQGIYETIRHEGGISDYDWESIHALANYVCDHWDEKGKGIWEFRDLHEHFVHSKLLCWVALDRAIEVANEYEYDAPFDRWEFEREAIREAIEERGYNEDLGSFVQYFDADEALDATTLLLPLYDFLPAEDERVQNTIDTVLEEMTTDDGLVYRFTDSPARPTESGGFVICSCWLVNALERSGRNDEAEELFESILDHTSDLGLLSEMIHVEDGTFLGNYPQAYSHIGLINSAMCL